MILIDVKNKQFKCEGTTHDIICEWCVAGENIFEHLEHNDRYMFWCHVEYMLKRMGEIEK